MEKEFIPYEQALELKELGFNQPCFGWWFADEEMLIIDKSTKSTSENIIQAPTFSQAFRWFREVYGLDCFIDKGGIKGIYHAFVGGSEHGFLYGNNGNRPSEFTYEEAELACLINLIEIVKEKK
jgi:hypothetical protein